MKTGLVSIVFALALVARAAAGNLPDINTPSGKPEVTVHDARIETVKSAIINHAMSNGWTVTGDSPNTLRLEQPANSLLVQMFLGSQANQVPNYRINFTFIQLGQDTRAIADSMIVTNPGTGLEQYTAMGDADPVKHTYFYLTQQLPGEVLALEKRSADAR